MDYKEGKKIVLTMDTSPIVSGWAIGQDDEDGNRYAVKFGAKVLSERQKKYPQVKKELWGMMIAMKSERE